MLHHSSGSSYQRKVMRERHEKQEKYTQLHKEINRYAGTVTLHLSCFPDCC